jgi:hypothetical protein
LEHFAMKSAPPIPSTKRSKRASAPPKHLALPERRLWTSITRENHFEGEAALALLRTALEAHQRMRTCRETIDRQGAVYLDRFEQPKVHPLLASERDSRAAFLSGMRALNLDLIGEQK